MLQVLEELWIANQLLDIPDSLIKRLNQSAAETELCLLQCIYIALIAHHARQGIQETVRLELLKGNTYAQIALLNAFGILNRRENEEK